MNFAVRLLLGVAAVFLVAGNSDAGRFGFLEKLFGEHEDCKKPYFEEIEKCRTGKQIKTFIEWNKGKEHKKVDEVLDECNDKAYKKLLECRVEKGKLKKGKKMKDLEVALNKVKEEEKQANDECWKQWYKKDENNEFKNRDTSYETFYEPCVDKVKGDILKKTIKILDEYVSVSKKGKDRTEVEETRKK